MNTISTASATPLRTAPPPRKASSEDGPAPKDTVVEECRSNDVLIEMMRHQSRTRAQAFERVSDTIDNVASLVGTAFWGGVGAVAGGLAGALAGGPIGLAVGAVGGAAALGTLYVKGHGDKMGKLMMAGSAIATGAMFGTMAGGPTGAAIGAGLGAAYSAAGLYFTWNES